MTVYALTTERMVEGLRAVADFFEANPADVGGSWAVSVDAYNLTAEQMAEIARTPGTWQKRTVCDGELFKLSRSFGPVTVAVYAERDEVCEARPTGRTTTIRKVVTPAVFEDVEVPEVEWDCRPLLGAGQVSVVRTQQELDYDEPECERCGDSGEIPAGPAPYDTDECPACTNRMPVR